MNKKALVPPILAVTGFLLSPEFYNLLPDKASHLIAAGAVVMATLFPQLFTKKDNA